MSCTRGRGRNAQPRVSEAAPWALVLCGLWCHEGGKSINTQCSIVKRKGEYFTLLPLQGVSGNTLPKTQGAASLTLGYVLVGPSARLAQMAVGPSAHYTEQFSNNTLVQRVAQVISTLM